MNVWLISREYAGIAEAGGVKNVACSLSESLVRLGHDVTLFIPQYRCTELHNIENYTCFYNKPVTFKVGDKDVSVSFGHGSLNGVEIILICHKCFAEKKAVYTYTREEELENPLHKAGEGHEDANFLNVVYQLGVINYATTCTVTERPDVVHCQDAPTALLPTLIEENCRKSAFFKKFFGKTKYFVTIHNAGPGYHHNYASIKEAMKFTGLPKEVLKKGLNNGAVEPFLLAQYNSCLTTVSPEYAKEILAEKTNTDGLSAKFNENGTDIVGITNGIDFSRYDPQDTKKSLLQFPFNPKKRHLEGKYDNRNFFLKNYASRNPEFACPEGIEKHGHVDYVDDREAEKYVYITYHGRVVHQKGIEVMVEACENLLKKNLPVRFMFAGQGNNELENLLADFTERHEGKAVYFKGYDRFLSRMVIASADFSLHPSWFEPCGLEDFIAQMFGTLPVAHATGGLCKIIDNETGYLYKPNKPDVLEARLETLITLMSTAGRAFFTNVISFASQYIHGKYSWDKVAFEYEKLYLGER